MKIDIGSNLELKKDFSEVTLPRNFENYIEVFSYFSEKGADFLKAFFKFNSNRILLKLEIDNVIIFEDLSLLDLDFFLGYNEKNLSINSPLDYSKDKKILELNYGHPVQFRESIKLDAKADSTSRSRKSIGYMAHFVNVLED